MAQSYDAQGNAFWYDDTKFDAGGNPVKSDFDTWLGTVSGNAPMQTKVKNYLSGLQTNYGLTTNDFDNALKSYGATYSDGGFLNDKNVGWWGEDAMLRAFGTGLDTLNPNAAYKGSWQSMWNQNAENAQQKDFADRFAANEANQGSDLADLGDIMKGVGLVAGVGGLAGAFSGLGGAASGAAAAEGGMSLAPGAFEGLSSSLVPAGANVVPAGLTAVGGGAAVPASSGILGALTGGAAGAAAGAADGWTSGADLPGVDSGLIDAPWGANPRPDVAATDTGGNMDWLDELINQTGTGTGTPTSGDPLSGLFGDQTGGFNTGGSDWATNGLNADGSINTSVMNAGNQGATGFLDQVKSLLSQGKNIPTSIIKSLFGTDDATSATLSRLIGTGLGGLLDYKASSGQADALKAIADRSWAAGQPYRDRANAAMTPGFDIKSIPGLSSAMDTATDTYLRRLSATNGNPAGIGAAPSQTQAFVLGNVALPAWQNYFNANSNAGGLSSLATQSTGAATQAAGADSAQYGSLGQTARNIFDPQPDNSRYLNLLAKQFGLV